MCGIAGFINHDLCAQNEKREKTLEHMLDSIRHRGPDGMGETHTDWYSIGHVRLSIIDPTPAGHQPMWDETGRYGIAYNGELYNYPQLREELKSLGHSFKTNCDTEVMLRSFIQWGVSAFSKYEGMFAAILIDNEKAESYIVRDQLGIKPLYYHEDRGQVVFSSEIKGLKPVLNQFKVNREAIYEHFTFRTVAGDRTLYNGIKRLLPGSYLHMRKGQPAKLHIYYRLTDSIHDNPHNDYDETDIEAMVNDSIRAHTISDVGYSVQLSGGIDSSYITTLLSAEKPKLDTYSIALKNAAEDESSYQDHVVKKCGTTHHRFDCDDRDFADLLPTVIQSLDFPVMHTGTVFLHLLCKHIAKDHKVVLTGEGADELFLGYSRYNIPRAHHIAFTLKSLGIKPNWLPDLPKIRGLKKLLQKDMGLDAGSFESDLPGPLLNMAGDLPYRKDMAAHFSTLMARMMATDQTAYLGSLLERQDKISMAHSVEVRVPFCNHKIFETVNAIQNNLKTKPAPKAILKKLLAKSYPDDFVYRRKNGFTLPLNDWFRNGNALSPYLDLLTDQSFKETGYFNAQTIQAMIDNHQAGTRAYGKELFNLVNFALWMKGL